ncbi:hypothetical protein TD95_002584 [Thielaviopsis punctulata]|uniref:AB hydrolase-1 domain-containing protein n=1 Tax=Thielaviopsis punctulata TaxID=72032 RepID=A0A0F4ZD47_9PEZI|nr:hypothetical protein TD95_002584 [Thielaviopsis punctulata]
MPPGSNHRPMPSNDSGLGVDTQDRHSRDYSQERDREPNEQTRLLSPERYEDRPPQWLSPDDPAVTPYNLWSVRILRLMTMVIAAITVIWFCVLLISMFATPPGMHTPGSVFYSLFYTIVSMITLTSLLLFFDAPAQSSRILSLIVAVVLVLDTVLVLAVEKTRIEEGWVGVASVLWALLISLWVILVDVTVKWGKAEEEERLTGRAETRRSAAEWIQVILSNVTLTCILVAYVLVSMNLILRAFDAALAPPGQQVWVDGGKYRMHVYCADVSTPDADSAPFSADTLPHPDSKHKPGKHEEPTLLLIGGEVSVEDGLWQVAQHAVHNGSIERYCMVDRPGYAWSDAAPSPLSASMSVAAITEALSLTGEHGPWVVAGAGTGSFYARIFAQQQGPEAVTGLLLIDPVHEQMLPELGGAARGFGRFLHGLITPLGLVRIPGAVLRGRSRADRVWGRTARQSAKTAFARLQENLVAGSLTQREVLATRTLLREWNVPLGLVSSGVQSKKDPQWDTFQRDLATLTKNLAGWETVKDAPHKIWQTEKGRWAVEGMMRKLVKG